MNSMTESPSSSMLCAVEPPAAAAATTEEKEKQERKQWCDSIFTNALQVLNKKTDVDEDLARATSQSLTITMGSSILTNLQSSSVVFPSKVHPALCNNSLSDVSVTRLSRSKINSSCGGVPGFPDFPNVWQGETSRERKIGYVRKKHTKKWKINNAREQQRRLARKAVNPAGMGKDVKKEIKKRLRDERRLRRKENAAQRLRRKEKAVQRRLRRKENREMGNLCRELSSINCE